MMGDDAAWSAEAEHAERAVVDAHRGDGTPHAAHALAERIARIATRSRTRGGQPAEAAHLVRAARLALADHGCAECALCIAERLSKAMARRGAADVLPTLRALARGAPQPGHLGAAAVLRGSLALDEAFWRLHYAQLLDAGSRGASEPSPSPLAYYCAVWEPPAQALRRIEQHLRQHADSCGTERRAGADPVRPCGDEPDGGGRSTWHSALAMRDFYARLAVRVPSGRARAADALAASPVDACPLSALALGTGADTLRLLVDSDLARALGAEAEAARGGASGREPAAGSKKRRRRDDERAHALPLAHPLVRAWRDACRRWACHLYAYAAPSSARALALVKRHAPVAEMGAGTGYWACALARAGVKVRAFDIAPTLPPSLEPAAARAPGVRAPAAGRSGGGSARANDFHGHAPAWARVRAAGPSELARLADGVSLLLCYPPPRSPMAAESVAAFRGRHVLLAGEWLGDTADGALHAALCARFELVERCALLQWADTAMELLVWRRRDPPAGASAAAAEVRLASGGVLACDACGASSAALRRCAHCRAAVFCSRACERREAAAHTFAHRCRGVELPRELDFDSAYDYRPGWLSSVDDADRTSSP